MFVTCSSVELKLPWWIIWLVLQKENKTLDPLFFAVWSVHILSPLGGFWYLEFLGKKSDGKYSTTFLSVVEKTPGVCVCLCVHVRICCDVVVLSGMCFYISMFLLGYCYSHGSDSLWSSPLSYPCWVIHVHVHVQLHITLYLVCAPCVYDILSDIDLLVVVYIAANIHFMVLKVYCRKYAFQKCHSYFWGN